MKTEKFTGMMLIFIQPKALIHLCNPYEKCMEKRAKTHQSRKKDRYSILEKKAEFRFF